ncbi:MAG TPA: hypothetical protein VNQ79_02200 [Blastocatellia bacterium]|nr:hypothetical protein [Blastocatellia bacterium]
MKPKRLILCIVVLSLLIPAPAAAKAKPRRQRAVRTQTARPSDSELRELLRRAEQAAAEARAEARLAREQSEELERRLAENTRELAGLRQMMLDYGARLAELKAPETAAPAAPAQPVQVSAPEASAVTERLDRLQEQVEVNAAQIREQAQTKVESDARHRVRLFGMILANTFFNSDDSSLTDVPLVALPAAAIRRRNNFGATLRQTRIGLAFDGPRLSPRLGEARVSAEAEFDFWGGTSGYYENDVLGALRIVTASARLDWERTSLIVGQRPPLVSPLNPTSLASVWLAPLAAAGNLWQWRPQLILEHRAKLKDSSELIMQGGVMMPFGESLQGRTIEGGPGYEMRLAARRGTGSDRNLEVGLGGYFHRRPFSFNRHVNSYAVTGDWTLPLGSRLEVSGEAYFGRAIEIAEQSGGGVERLYAVSGPLDNPATAIRGVHAAGGWMQLAVKARNDLDFNFAYGQNDPRNRDVRSGQSVTSLKNQVASANFIWQLRHNFLVSLEYRRLWTNYATQQRTNNHVNLAFGYVF